MRIMVGGKVMHVSPGSLEAATKGRPPYDLFAPQIIELSTDDMTGDHPAIESEVQAIRTAIALAEDQMNQSQANS